MAREKGISRLTPEQIQQLGEWRLKGYLDAEIASATGYSVSSISRFIRIAIARLQIPAACRNRALTSRNRQINHPLPPLPCECWNTPQTSKYSVAPHSTVFYSRVQRGWSQEEAASAPPRTKQLEKVSRNQAILDFWEKNRNYLATAKEFELSAERIRRIVIRQLQKRRNDEARRAF